MCVCVIVFWVERLGDGEDRGAACRSCCHGSLSWDENVKENFQKKPYREK